MKGSFLSIKFRESTKYPQGNIFYKTPYKKRPRFIVARRELAWRAAAWAVRTLIPLWIGIAAVWASSFVRWQEVKKLAGSGWFALELGRRTFRLGYFVSTGVGEISSQHPFEGADGCQAVGSVDHSHDNAIAPNPMTRTVSSCHRFPPFYM